MSPFETSRPGRTALAIALTLLPVSGCHHQTTATGSMDSPGQPASIDNSWINAARSCWPDLAQQGYSNADIARNLLNHLGSAFPAYSALSARTLDADLSMPITSILPPDVTKLENSSTPVLTRGQAVAGTPPRQAIVQSTHGQAPPDSLCSIQSGIPDGFSK